MNRVFFIISAFIFMVLLSATDGYSLPEYCPIPAGNSCDGCHSTPGTNGWPACPTTPTTWTITASAGANGSISPSGAVTVTGGGSQQFTITPIAGYAVGNVLIDGASVGPQTIYTFSNVTANHTISATFILPVGPPPMADFSMTPMTTTDPYIVSFTDLSTDGPTSWLWDFGDGTISTQQDPYHAYLLPGPYTVTLEASNRNGIDITALNLDVAFTSCPNGSVDLGGWQQDSIQAAYDSAVDGEIIKLQASEFAGGLIFDKNITVTLSGGHDCNYSINPAQTRISSGSLTISNGTLIVENLVIRSSTSTILDGALLYDQNCFNCHGALANSTKIGTTATAVQSAINNNTGDMGILSSLTPDEIQAIVDALNEQTPPTTSCTSCHGQPPSGSSFPDTAGAHSTHDTLGFGSVVPTCAACHDGATHQNGTPDLGIPANFDAQSGTATGNGNLTCSSVKCHGGQTTPNWLTGSINVNTDCASCHTRRTSGDTYPDQYNDYYSGQHRRHVESEGYACTVCHNISVLQNGHFTNLETPVFEQNPADTIGGGTTRVGSYSNGTCSSIECHGSEQW